MSDFQTVNQRLPRREAALKATGKALYTEDYYFQDMAYGCIIRSPHSYARVLNIDVARAEQAAGFLGVLLPEEVEHMVYNCSGNPPSPLLLKDEKILTNRPLCAGDRILAVAACSKRELEQIVSLIKITYEVMTPALSIKDALKEGAEPLQPHISPTNVLAVRQAEQGNAAEGFVGADLIFEDDFYTAPMQHVAMEPTSCICDFSDQDHLNIWSNSQTPYQERRIMAELFQMRESDIRIIKPIMGGGFGARQQLHSQPAAALLSKKIRRPLQIVHTREEEMYGTVTRHEMEAHLRFGLSAEGILKAFQTEFYLNGGPYTTHTPTIVAAASRKFQYRVENYLFHGYSVATNCATAGAFRGYGNAQLTFGRELMMSRMARTLHMDPVAFRLKNHVKAGEKFPAATAAVTSCVIEECAARCMEIKDEIDRTEGLIDNEEIRQAWGVAFSCHGSGPSSKEGMSSAVIMANDDGTVHLLAGSADIGQGSETILAQIAAEALNLSMEEIAVTAADTGITPYDTGTFGSSQTYVSGNAVALACEDLLEKTRKALSDCLDAKVIYQDKVFYAEEAGGEESAGQQSGEPQLAGQSLSGRQLSGHQLSGRRFSFAQAVRQIIFELRGTVLIGTASYKAKESPNPFAVCMVKAEYEKKTNSIILRHVIEVVDVGTAINPLLVEGQIEGGVAQGIGYALTECLEYNKLVKKTSSSDLLLYRIPLMGDMPKIHTAIVSSYEPTGPSGAKSVGELSTVPVAPAIVDAVSEASGQKINKIPLSDYFMIKPNRR